MSTLSQVRILDAWRALGGPEPRCGRAPAWWRESHDPNASIDAERGVFYDHVQGRGGGVLALVETVLNCDRAEALVWLEREGFIEPRTLTHEQRRQYTRRRDEASTAAPDIAYWRCAAITELTARKLAALDAGDDVALERAATLCNLLENGPSEDVIREFIRERAADRVKVARFVARGKERDCDDRRIAAEVVLLLARVAELKEFANAK